ncbi:MAG: ATP-binding protein [Gammaproteobacteria bacterium]
MSQSKNAFPLVAGAGSIYGFALWDEVNSVYLLSWVGSCIFFAALRSFICHRIEKSFDDISLPQLHKNDLLLFLTAMGNTIAIGTGFWWVCLGGSERVILAMTILCCIYAVGTTVNSAIHSRDMPALLLLNLGQGIVFFGFVRSPADIEVAVALMALIYLLIQFSNRVTVLFRDSIRIRDENIEKNLKLEEQNALVEQSLNAARSANEEKSRFLAAASHDLRQPLHAMTLFLGSLRRLVSGKTEIELVEKIDETTHILHNQFNSLLDLSKFDAGVVEANISSFRLDSLLNKIAKTLEPEAQAKGFSIELDLIPVGIHSDVLLLERLLTNLILNAVNFTDSGYVSIALRQDQSALSIAISDTGRGIALEDQEKIFQDYYQVHNKARSKNKGTGLGLAIVKRIADLLGMKLQVSSELGEGSTFSIIVPEAQVFSPDAKTDENEIEASNPSRSIDRNSSVIKNTNILIVDDDVSILDALSGVVSNWGAKPTVATTFNEVKSSVEKGGQFEIAILDDMLAEETTGLDIALFLNQKMSPDRILITTGNTDVKRLQELRSSGFVVLIKPVDEQQLESAIVEALET